MSLTAILAFYRAWRPLCNALALLALLAGAVGLWWAEREAHARHAADQVRTQYEFALAQQRAQAAAELKAEQAKTAAIEQRWRAAITHQEAQDREHTATIQDLQRRVAAAAAAGAGRLRDPHAIAQCGPGGGGPAAPGAPAAGPGAPDAPEAGGLLSAELTGLLQRLTREADDINAAYASCRAERLQLADDRPPAQALTDAPPTAPPDPPPTSPSENPPP